MHKLITDTVELRSGFEVDMPAGIDPVWLTALRLFGNALQPPAYRPRGGGIDWPAWQLQALQFLGQRDPEPKWFQPQRRVRQVMGEPFAWRKTAQPNQLQRARMLFGRARAIILGVCGKYHSNKLIVWFGCFLELSLRSHLGSDANRALSAQSSRALRCPLQERRPAVALHIPLIRRSCTRRRWLAEIQCVEMVCLSSSQSSRASHLSVRTLHTKLLPDEVSSLSNTTYHRRSRFPSLHPGQ
eukprot:s5461_g1.t3